MLQMSCRPDGNKYMEAVHLVVLLDLLEVAGIQNAFGRTCLYSVCDPAVECDDGFPNPINITGFLCPAQLGHGMARPRSIILNEDVSIHTMGIATNESLSDNRSSSSSSNI